MFGGMANRRMATPAYRHVSGIRTGAMAPDKGPSPADRICRGPRKQLALPEQGVLFSIAENLNTAIVPIISGLDVQFTGAHAADRFPQQGNADAIQLLRRGIPQDMKLISKRFQRQRVRARHSFGGRPHLEQLRQDFRQGNEAFKRWLP